MPALAIASQQELKENLRPAAYNIEASALRFTKPPKVNENPEQFILPLPACRLVSVQGLHACAAIPHGPFSHAAFSAPRAEHVFGRSLHSMTPPQCLLQMHAVMLKGLCSQGSVPDGLPLCRLPLHALLRHPDQACAPCTGCGREQASCSAKVRVECCTGQLKHPSGGARQPGVVRLPLRHRVSTPLHRHHPQALTHRMFTSETAHL